KGPGPAKTLSPSASPPLTQESHATRLVEAPVPPLLASQPAPNLPPLDDGAASTIITPAPPTTHAADSPGCGIASANATPDPFVPDVVPSPAASHLALSSSPTRGDITLGTAANAGHSPAHVHDASGRGTDTAPSTSQDHPLPQDYCVPGTTVNADLADVLIQPPRPKPKKKSAQKPAQKPTQKTPTAKGKAGKAGKAVMQPVGADETSDPNLCSPNGAPAVALFRRPVLSSLQVHTDEIKDKNIDDLSEAYLGRMAPIMKTIETVIRH
ncbi:hypothetical protein BD779DRAFT_1671687, partial [Infundibulicybe gibba]